MSGLEGIIESVRAKVPGVNRMRGEHLLTQARLAGPMPWVIAIMIALTTIAAAGALALSNVASTARADLAGGITVQIVESVPGRRDQQAQAALALIRNSAGVESAVLVPRAELQRLMEPWLGGSGSGDEAIPVPALIDVRLAGEATREAVERLRDRGLIINTLRLRAFPFQQEVLDFVDRHELVFVIEQNRDGQMRSLLMSEGGLPAGKLVSLPSYDGLPVASRFLVQALVEALAERGISCPGSPAQGGAA